MSAPLHLVRVGLDLERLHRLSSAHRLSRGGFDPGYAVHAALAGLFGKDAPGPFALEERRGRVLPVLGYSEKSFGALEEHARTFANPELFAVCDWSTSAGKPMPEAFARGARLGFHTRVCPVVRKASAGEKHRAGAEVDVFLSRCFAVGSDVPVARASVYIEWLRARLGEGVVLERAEMTRFVRERFTRRRQGEGREPVACERPDVDLEGIVRVEDAVAFHDILRRGVGRHRAFGFGMLLLRPPRPC